MRLVERPSPVPRAPARAALQECFAIVGIAAGVALLFASQVASESLSSSVARALARDRRQRDAAADSRATRTGFDERLLAHVRALPRRAASPRRCSKPARTRSGPHGQRVGASSSAPTRASRSSAARSCAARSSTPFAGIGAVVLPAPLAQQIGVTQFGAEVTLEVGGRSVSRAPLYAQLTAKQIGGADGAPDRRRAAGIRAGNHRPAGRALTRILIQPRAGRAKRRVRAALARSPAGG